MAQNTQASFYDRALHGIKTQIAKITGGPLPSSRFDFRKSIHSDAKGLAQIEHAKKQLAQVQALEALAKGTGTESITSNPTATASKVFTRKPWTPKPFQAKSQPAPTAAMPSPGLPNDLAATITAQNETIRQLTAQVQSLNKAVVDSAPKALAPSKLNQIATEAFGKSYMESLEKNSNGDPAKFNALCERHLYLNGISIHGHAWSADATRHGKPELTGLRRVEQSQRQERANAALARLK